MMTPVFGLRRSTNTGLDFINQIRNDGPQRNVCRDHVNWKSIMTNFSTVAPSDYPADLELSQDTSEIMRPPEPIPPKSINTHSTFVLSVSSFFLGVTARVKESARFDQYIRQPLMTSRSFMNIAG